jgi:hypothetical protein
MKKIFLFTCFCIAIGLFACSLAEQDNQLLVGSCMDSIRNQNEEGIDCGGICGGECVYIPPVTVPCEDELQDNVIKLDGLDFELTDDNYSVSVEDDYIKIFILKSFFEEITIQIYGISLPTTTTEYDLAGWFDLNEGEASITYLNTYRFHGLDGKLYVRYENSKWNIEICPTYLTGHDFEWEFSGRIIYSE